MLCRRSLSLSLREYFVDQMVVVVVRSLLYLYSLSSFLLSFRISLGYSNPTCFHVASFLLSVSRFGEKDDFTSYNFRATRTHTHTKLKKNAIHDRPKSLRVRALPDENDDETGEN